MSQLDGDASRPRQLATMHHEPSASQGRDQIVERFGKLVHHAGIITAGWSD